MTSNHRNLAEPADPRLQPQRRNSDGSWEHAQAIGGWKFTRANAENPKRPGRVADDFQRFPFFSADSHLLRATRPCIVNGEQRREYESPTSERCRVRSPNPCVVWSHPMDRLNAGGQIHDLLHVRRESVCRDRIVCRLASCAAIRAVPRSIQPGLTVVNTGQHWSALLNRRLACDAS